jgi:S1-C subfamily serine protease
MSSRKITLFYLPLIIVASVAVGMVIASRLDLAPTSSAQTIAVPPMNSAPLMGPLSADTFRNIAKAQSPMVVNIKTEMKAKSQDLEGLFGGGGGGGSDDFFRRFFGGPGGGQGQGQGQGDDDQAPKRGNRRAPIARAAGTGFIINGKDGFILTNNHVVEDATKIEVYLYTDDETPYTAKVIGRDVLTDSALIQLVDRPTAPLPEAKFGDSAQMQPGDWVMAIGNPFSLAHTISVGVISATKRPFQVTDQRSNEMLQTDAAINPGNSGGPLLDSAGRLIGVNTAIVSPSGASAGIGVAIPVVVVNRIVPELIKAGRIRNPGIGIIAAQEAATARLGIDGVVIVRVLPGTPAAQAGLRGVDAQTGDIGDVIVEANGRPVHRLADLTAAIEGAGLGAAVTLKVERDGRIRQVRVTTADVAENRR